MALPPNPGSPAFFQSDDVALRRAGVAKRSGGAVADAIRAKLKSPPEDPVDAMVMGSDATIVVDRWTRQEAKAEAVQGAALDLALRLRADAAWAPLTRETFAELYDRSLDRLPTPEGTLGNFVAEALSHAREMPEWQRLRDRCGGDSFLAALGAHTLLETLDAGLPATPQDDPDLLEEMARVQPTAERKEAAKLAREAMNQAMSLMTNERGALRTAARHGVKRATDALDEVVAMARSFGVGDAMGTVSAGDLRATAEAMRANPKLKEIAEIAGRLRVHASKVRKTKVNHIPEEVVEVTTGSDIGRLTSAELGSLADPMLELGLMQRLHDGAASIHKMRGNEAAAKGPVIFCLDESSSMSGDPDTYCKAVALVMAEIALRGKRDFALVHFASTVKQVDYFLASDGPSVARLAGALGAFAGGGTDIGAALMEAHIQINFPPHKGGKLGLADVVLVTDGCSALAPIAKAIGKLHESGARVHMVAIGAPNVNEREVIALGDTSVNIEVGSVNDQLNALMSV